LEISAYQVEPRFNGWQAVRAENVEWPPPASLELSTANRGCSLHPGRRGRLLRTLSNSFSASARFCWVTYRFPRLLCVFVEFGASFSACWKASIACALSFHLRKPFRAGCNPPRSQDSPSIALRWFSGLFELATLNKFFGRPKRRGGSRRMARPQSLGRCLLSGKRNARN